MEPHVRILVVDDNAAGRYALSQCLRRAGYEVKEAATARECMETLEQFEADLVVLDVKLPDANGMEVCRKLKNAPRTEHVAVIQISALFTATEDRIAGLEGGADAYLAAPFEPRELLAYVRSLLKIRRTEAALRSSEERSHSIEDNLPDSAVYQYVYDADGKVRFLYCSAGIQQLNGVTAEEVLKDPAVLHRQIRPDYYVKMVEQGTRAARDLTDFDMEVPMRRPDGEERWMRLHSRPRRQPDGTIVWDGVQTDVTSRRAAEREIQATLEFLTQINTTTGVRKLIAAAAQFFAKECSCEAVGVRLKKGDDYPYYETRGFSAEFVAAESRLCCDEQEPMRGAAASHPALACMCGNVICGRIDKTKPFFSEGGSFWTNSTSRLLGTTTEQDRNARTRNRCNGEGYESVALIPLRAGNQTLGLLQLNDRQPGKFSPAIIAFCERLCGWLAVTIAKAQAEEALAESRERLRLATTAARLFAFEWEPTTDRVRREGDFASILGVEFEEETGKSFFARLHPEDRDKFIETLRCLCPERDFYSTTYRVIRPDGAVATLEESGRALFDEQGRFVRLIGMTSDVTARMQAQAELRRKEERYRLLAETMLQGVVHQNAGGTIVSMNPAAERILGKTREVFLGSSSVDQQEDTIREDGSAFPGLEHPSMVALRTGLPVRGVIMGVFNPVQRERRWISIDAVPVFVGDVKQPAEVYAVFEDITERRRSEAALRTHRELLETVVNNLPVCVNLIRGDDLRLELVNAAYQAIAPGKAMVGKTLDEIWPELQRNFAAICRRVLETGEPYHVQDEPSAILRHPGEAPETAYFSWSLHRIPMPGSSTWGLLNTAWETTARRRTEEALRESEYRLRLAKSASQLGIHDFNIVTGELHWDERLRELWGLGPNDPVNYKVFLSGIHPDDRAQTDEAIRHALDPQGDGRCSVEYRLVTKGMTRWIAATGHALFENGKPVRLIGTAQDITRSREFQAELERLVKERTAKLHDTVAELEHFSYTITHDMRAPLRAMRGFAEVVNEINADHPEPQVRMCLDRIIGAAERMDALITDALNYSKAARQELPVGPIDVFRLIEGMLETYPQFLAHKANIRVSGPFRQVLGNEAALVQCFSNLIGNAIKFVEPGKMPDVSIWSEVIGASNHERVRFCVEDKGIGISKAMLPRIFDMFSRGAGHYEGTGIGLALVRKVVQRMGGSVGVQSEPGHGSRFFVDLPAANISSAFQRNA